MTRILTARRVSRSGYAAGIPVICVGNAGIGGAGKTIVVLDLMTRLSGRPFALTRGYKGRLAGPIRVTAAHTARAVGDEVVLLAAAGPTILARNRAAGAKLAIAEGASVIVMDDGLQNPGLAKTASFLVIDGGYGFGNAQLLPAGPLREPVAAAASRCLAAICIGADVTNALAALPQSLPVLHAELQVSCATPLAGAAVVAFAGIGRPEKFFASVRALGADIAAAIPFADHHAYSAEDASRLVATATARQAILVTTAKDFVKLPTDLQACTAVVLVALAWQDEKLLQKLLAGIV